MSPARLAARPLPFVARSARATLVLWTLSLAPACATPLLATRIETTEAHVEEFRRGGLWLSCHELPSNQFRLYLVCPEQKTSLGVSVSSGHLGFTCPNLRKKKCRELVQRVQDAGARATAP